MGIVVEFYAVAPDGPGAADGGQATADAKEEERIGGHLAVADLAIESGLLLESVPVNSLASRELWDLLARVGIDPGSGETTEHFGIEISQTLIDQFIHAAAPNINQVDLANPVTNAIANAASAAFEESAWKGSRLVMVIS